MFASWWELASQHFLSFGCGVIVGLLASSRYRIIKRNGEDH